MTQYIGQITIILEAETSELASDTLRFVAKQLDDTRPEVVFADHNGEVEDYEKIERECEESSTAQHEAELPLLTLLLASLEKCATLLADYDEKPGEEGIAYREALAAIAKANAARLPSEPTALNIDDPQLLETLEYLANQADEDCPQEYRSRHFIDALDTARTIVVKARTAHGES
jgi:hypothetical protein